MPRVCPKPCTQLATAAVFIAVGVVQLLVGVILLRSEYADLLCGPDFMTASSNIAVGCIYGITSSIWENDIKDANGKRRARRNVLSALLISIITINMTTAMILIMGDGHELLTLYLDGSRIRHDTASFANEVLACAYLTSVCSPIVCLAVAFVALCGNCFQARKDDKATPYKTNSVSKEDEYGWVFESKSHCSLDGDFVQALTPSSKLSASEEGVFFLTKSDNSQHLSTNSIPSPVSTWERCRARSDSELEDEAFCNDSSGRQRLKQSIRNEIRHKIMMSPKNVSVYCNDKLSKVCGSVGGSPYRPVPDETDLDKCTSYIQSLRHSKSNATKRGRSFSISNKKSKSRQSEDSCKSTSSTVESSMHVRASKAKSCGDIVARVDKKCGSTKKFFKEREADGNEQKAIVDPALSKLKAETLLELKQRVKMILPEVIEKSEKNETAFSPLKDSQCLENAGGSSASEDGMCDVFQDDSISKEVAFDRCSYSKSLTVPDGPSLIDRNRSKSFDFSLEKLECHFRACEDASASMARKSDPEKFRNKRKNLILDCPKTCSLKQDRIRECTRKSSMASIAEMPAEEGEDDAFLEKSVINNTLTTAEHIDENSNIRLWSSSTIKIQANRKSSTPSSLLKRMWSSSTSQKPDICNLVMDPDSLIGLSDEELLARTSRLRSLRQSVSDRMNSESRS